MALAHENGVIHRDIKPSNIMLKAQGESSSEKIPLVVDFGIARVVENAMEQMTRTGEIVGTPLYMSPEQSMGRKVDQRSDIYSLACVIFHSLTGAPPFCGESALATMMMHTSEPLPTLKEASMGKQFPSALEAVMAKALAKDPADRYQNCEEFAAELARVEQTKAAAGLSPVAAPPPRLTNKTKSSLAVALAIAICGCIGATLYLGKKTVPAANSSAGSTKEQPKSADPAYDLTSSKIPETQMTDFSTIVGNERVFHFPKTLNLGQMLWKEAAQSQYQQRDAMGEVRVPVKSKIAFVMGIDLLNNPGSVSYFKSGDMQTVVVRANELASDANINRAISNLMSIDSIHELFLQETPLTRKTFSKIGDLPDLTWLVARDTGPNTAEAVNLKNLNKLKILGLMKYKGGPVTPILKHLLENHTRLVGLTLTDDPYVSANDIDLISKFPELEVLDLRYIFAKGSLSELQRQRILGRLGKLTHLKYLCIDGEVLGAVNPAVLKQFQHLSYLFFEDKTIGPTHLAQLKTFLPNCEIFDAAIDSDHARTVIRGFFDPLRKEQHWGSGEALKAVELPNLEAATRTPANASPAATLMRSAPNADDESFRNMLNRA
ncbi:MAG: serine/threonine protein kinase, partial [Terriglobales bacterium]